MTEIQNTYWLNLKRFPVAIRTNSHIFSNAYVAKDDDIACLVIRQYSGLNQKHVTIRWG